MCRRLPTNQANIHMTTVGFETTSCSFAGGHLTTGPRHVGISKKLHKLKNVPVHAIDVRIERVHSTSCFAFI